MDASPGLIAPPHQRARGELRLAFKRRGDESVLDVLRQDGCLKARFPRPDSGPPGEQPWAHAVTLNSAGGIAGGDVLETSVTVGAGASATVAAQAAERVYRALPGATARVSTTLRVQAGAALEWLPQETILFDRCAMRRTIDIDLAEDARFLGVESLVFGRTAMDEEVHSARLHDRIGLRRGGRLVLHDAIRLDGPVARLLDRAAMGGGARAVATLIQVAPVLPLEALRVALAGFEAGYEAGASVVEGVLVARIVAPTGAILRDAVVTGLNILRGGRTLPRVWLC